MRRPVFLELQFPTDISFNRPFGPTHNVDVQITEGGNEDRNEFWGGEYRSEGDVGYGVRKQENVAIVNELFNAAQGMALGFRYRDWGDWKSVPITEASNQNTDIISATDQVISVDPDTADIFQLIKTDRFGIAANRKTITKPVESTVLVAIQGIAIPSSRFNLTYVPRQQRLEGHKTVGRVTLSANIQKTVTGITQAAAAVVTTSTAHGLAVNDSVHFGTDVGGMTQIRGKRGLITAVGDTTHFTVAIDTSSGYSAFTSGGTINTQRQSFAYNVGISAIEQDPFPIVTASANHNLVAGDVGEFSGVGGMTGLNSLTATVLRVLTDTTFQIDVSTLDFSAYTSGGLFAVSERVTAGYEYDLPVRFNTNHLPRSFEAWAASGVDLSVIELRVKTS
jgi:uncharacterized protein (TIGR02217 family)